MKDLEIFLSESEINDLNNQLAAQISTDYRKILTPGEELLVVVTLKGALFFASDLIRRMDIPVCIDFVRVSSYGKETESSGNVRLIKDIEKTIPSQHILVLDEIVDSGRTLKFLLEHLKQFNPGSLKIAALLNKPSRREVSLSVDYLGRDVEDLFLVGYGLDFAEKYRSLKDIYILKSPHTKKGPSD
jgi:hypoxanthine phosphoribosyltransferase